MSKSTFKYTFVFYLCLVLGIGCWFATYFNPSYQKILTAAWFVLLWISSIANSHRIYLVSGAKPRRLLALCFGWPGLLILVVNVYGLASGAITLGTFSNPLYYYLALVILPISWGFGANMIWVTDEEATKYGGG